MNIHEYQAKVLFRKFGIRVPNGDSVTTVDRGIQVAETLRAPYVVKAQIHAGGRGAGKIKDDPSGKGGVRIASSVDEVRSHVNSMLGKVLITKQTGSEGKTVNSIYIEEACNIERELYLSFLVDRNKRRICVIASTEGGMDIEEIAVTAPQKIKKIFIDPITGMMPFHARSIAFFLQLKDKQISECVQFLTALYQAFVSLDASLVEINPLVLTKEGHLLALDAKVSFDDNSLFRHPDILRLRDKTEDDPMEVQASEYGLNYVKLHGNIGCMVNGAGLAMATMDIIQLKGASPANFLDVGGGADKERVKKAFQILLSDSSVKGILVNIFGGIMRCDIIANGILEAIKEIKLSVPVVVRLEGTNVEKGKSLLAESGLAIIPANNLDDAAEKIVQSIQ